MSSDSVSRSNDLDRRIAESDIGKRISGYERNVKLLTISVILDILLSIVVGILGWATYHTSRVAKAAADKATAASNKATSASSQSRINCIAANESRSQQRQLWRFVLSFPPPQSEDPAAARTRLADTKKFKNYITKVFAPHNCNAPVLPTQQPSFPAGAKIGQPQATQGSGRTTVIILEPTPDPAPQMNSHQTKPSDGQSPKRSSQPSTSTMPTPTPTPTPICTKLPVLPICRPIAATTLATPAPTSSAGPRAIAIATTTLQGGLIYICITRYRRKT